MNSFSKDSTHSPVEFQAPSRKRVKESKGGKKSKRQKVRKEEVENLNSNVENAEATKEEESPIYIPSLSSPEPETPENCVDTPIQSHANVDPR